VAQMHQYFPKLCPPSCGLEMNFRRIRTSARIQCLTLSEVEKITGGPGRYQATIRRHPRRVNNKCTACGACVEACPIQRPDELNCRMSSTKAIYLPFEMAYPLQFVVDGSACPGTECGKCVPACPYQAIDLQMKPETIEVEVQAAIWATGWDPFDAGKIDGLGFGTLPERDFPPHDGASRVAQRTHRREDSKAFGRQGNRKRGVRAVRRVAR